jgi:hypothetical protein
VGSGGSGGGPAPDTARDSRLLERALREHWPIPDTLRKGLVARLAKIIADPDSSKRSVVAAAKTLATLSRGNLAAVETAIRAEQHEDLNRRLDELEQAIQEATRD